MKFAILLPLFVGLALRAATPAGYMPGMPGSGLLFELCPDQLPAGATLAPSQTSGHHHHHGDSTGEEDAPAADQCQIGHLLLSSIAIDSDSSIGVEPLPFVATRISNSTDRPSRMRVAWRSRGPPA